MRRELHSFSEASERGYGVVTYLRCVNGLGQVFVQLLLAKARVASLKQVTNPRLELVAAVLSTKLVRKLEKELHLTIDSVTYWVHSQVVLGFISAEAKRFHTFVANRVQAILEVSKPSHWRHCPGTLNPADYASRGLRAAEMLTKSWWHSGPQFLSQRFIAEELLIPRQSPRTTRSSGSRTYRLLRTLLYVRCRHGSSRRNCTSYAVSTRCRTRGCRSCRRSSILQGYCGSVGGCATPSCQNERSTPTCSRWSITSRRCCYDGFTSWFVIRAGLCRLARCVKLDF